MRSAHSFIQYFDILKRSEVTKEKYLETVLVLVLACLVIGYLAKNNYFYLASFILGLIGLFIPFLAEWITFLWFKLSEGIGFVTSKILLSFVFFIILFPISLLKKLFTKNDKIATSDSNWVTREHTYTKQDLQNPW